MPDAPEDRLARARQALEGLSVGDAFGEQFFRHRTALVGLWAKGDAREANWREQVEWLGQPPWRWTDDTAMALAILGTLKAYQGIDTEALARAFAAEYAADPTRGYGPAMHQLLPQLRRRGAWQTAARLLFGGQGSFGNGAAMRVAPIGAYFADSPENVVEHARRSAVVTHAHPEAVAGAIAIAAAAACAWQLRDAPIPPPADFLERVLAQVPGGRVAAGIREARDLPPATSVHAAARALGNGTEISAHDTVPFVLWSAARRLDDYAEALWETASGLGDMDTTCAMVGGIVVMYTGLGSIPAAWRRNREPLPGE